MWLGVSVETPTTHFAFDIIFARQARRSSFCRWLLTAGTALLPQPFRNRLGNSWRGIRAWGTATRKNLGDRPCASGSTSSGAFLLQAMGRGNRKKKPGRSRKAEHGMSCPRPHDATLRGRGDLIGGNLARSERKNTTPVESLKHKDTCANIPTEELRDFAAGES